jgi:cell division protein ZapA (FtsZ GTPase activity inhibitor)
MAEPENLVLELLREMRADVRNVRDEQKEDIRGVRNAVDSILLRLDYFEEQVEMLRESTMTALGFAVDASERKKKIETQLAELRERVERLEKAK